MGDLVLVRHGETEWTVSRRHTSYTDLPLTARGEDQARSAARHFTGTADRPVLTSPLQRAQRTAELAGLRRATIEPDCTSGTTAATKVSPPPRSTAPAPAGTCGPTVSSPARPGTPGNSRSTSVLAPTGSSPGSARCSTTRQAATWSSSPTPTSSGYSPPGVWACRPPPGLVPPRHRRGQPPRYRARPPGDHRVEQQAPLRRRGTRHLRSLLIPTASITPPAGGIRHAGRGASKRSTLP